MRRYILLCSLAINCILLIALIISLSVKTQAVSTPALKPSAHSELSSSQESIPEEEESIEEPTLVSLGEFRVTAYCACVKCCGIWSAEHPSRKGTNYIQKTASGTIPKAGRTIAADTSVLPFGTVVIIDGHEYIVEDRGSAIRGNSIDIYFDSHTDALNWGVQTKIIYIKGDK